MKRWIRSRWLWATLIVAGAVVGAILYLQHSVTNVMHPALDKLSAVNLSERWSHPEMLKIRALGDKAVPSLRRVLREKNNPATRFLSWVKKKWPSATKYYSHFPDPQKLTERRWAACQALQSLGPAARPAMPEILEIFKSGDQGDLNSASMVLHSIGIDADICEQLDELMEKGVSESGRIQITFALSRVKPPSARTLKVLSAALTNSSEYVQHYAAESLGQLGVSTPEVISALKFLQSTTTNELTVVSSSTALWRLEKNAGLALPPVLKVLETQLNRPLIPAFGGGSGGQGVNQAEQLFMGAGALFREMNLVDPQKSKALGLLEQWCDKSGRIFIRMLLLPAMMDLGLPREKCLDVCSTGLQQPEDYYRIQAARLLAAVAEKYAVDEIDVNALLQHQDVGVRVYAAKIHWLKNRQAAVVLPILIESLNRSKHQSYYYSETLSVALSVLGDLGPEAAAAAGDLEQLTHDPNPDVVKQASAALAKVRK